MTPREKIVYCGPSIKNVARQYTVYEGDISPLLKEYAESHPIIKQLILPLDEFAQFRVRVATAWTRENILYRTLLSEM